MDNELNDILESIRNGETKKEYDEIKLPEIKNEPLKAEGSKVEVKPVFELTELEATPEKKEELEPPKPSKKEKAEKPEMKAMQKEEKTEKKTFLEPPKPSVKEEKAESEDELLWIASDEKAKEIKKNDFSADKVKNLSKKLFTKASAIKLGVAALIVVMIFASIKIAQFAKVAYLKPYEEKYKITYPVGIKKSYCDEYGKNPSLAGTLEIEDTNTKENLYSKPKGAQARLEKGSDINTSQHFRAAALSSEKCDLEKYYSTAKAYKKASKKMKLTTIYGDVEEYTIVAAYYTNTKAKDDNGYIFPYNVWGNMTEKSFPIYQDRIGTRSLYKTGYEIQYNDYCFTVSVDSDIMKDFRFVVLGVKADKKIKDSIKVTKNDKIRYPQAYCDKLGIRNIYHLASDWYPEIYDPQNKGKTIQLSVKDFE